MASLDPARESTQRELIALRTQVEDLRTALEAIRSGGVDAVVIGEPGCEQKSPLVSADRPFRVIVEEMGQAACTVSESGRVLYANRRMAELVGGSRGQLLGTDAAALLESGQPERLGQLLSVKPGETMRCELELVTRTGARRPVLASVTGMDLEGAIVRCVVAADLSEEKQAAALLAASEQRYRLLAENANDVVYAATPDRRVTWISQSVTRTLGWTATELVGIRMAELVHPQDRAATDADRVLDYRGLPTATPQHGHQVRMRTKDGSYRWMASHIRQLSDDAGQFTGVVGGLTLIEAVVAAQQRAESDRDRLQATLDSLMDPHILFTPVRDEHGVIVDFKCLAANDAACRAAQMPRAQLIGSLLLVAQPSLRHSPQVEALMDVATSRTPVVRDNVEFRWPGAQAASFIELRATAVSDLVSITWRDVTERHAAEVALARGQEQYRVLAENASDIVLRCTPQAVIEWVSPAIQTVLGLTPDQAMGQRLFDLVHPGDNDRMGKAVDRVNSGQPAKYRARICRADGYPLWMQVQVRPVLDGDGQVVAHIAGIHDIHAQVRAEAQLRRLASHDALTGLLQRDEALNLLTEILTRNRRSPGTECAILFCDVDDFKTINDRHGHAAGDRWLVASAQRMVAATRRDDVVARIGGDEFLIILNQVHDLVEATRLADKVRSCIAEPVGLPDGSQIASTISIGVTLADSTLTVDQLIARSDHAMYLAKRAGGDRVARFDASSC